MIEVKELLSLPKGLEVITIDRTDSLLIVHAVSTQIQAACSLCWTLALLFSACPRQQPISFHSFFPADECIAQTAELMIDFATMLREWQGERLDTWLELTETQEVAELRSFAQGLRKDYDAVKTGLTLCWSNGQVEGQVHRLKLLKRQAYGRAGFETLRKRVLRRA